MNRIWRLLVALFGLFGAVQALAQAPNPIPVTGNLSQILGGAQPYASVQFSLQNCSAPITITGYYGVVNTTMTVLANASGLVNTTIWPVDLLNCNGTTGHAMYGVKYIVGGVPTGPAQCYQPVSTMGTWNLTTLQSVPCGSTPPDPQDAQYRNLNITGCLTVQGGPCETPLPLLKVNICGTTTTCANTAQLLPRIVWGTVALTSATPSTAVVAGMTAWTATTSFACTVTNRTTQANPVSVTNTSTTSITITGPNTVTDTVSYICVGN